MAVELLFILGVEKNDSHELGMKRAVKEKRKV
jgi:hypothetical protein